MAITLEQTECLHIIAFLDFPGLQGIDALRGTSCTMNRHVQPMLLRRTRAELDMVSVSLRMTESLLIDLVEDQDYSWLRLRRHMRRPHAEALTRRLRELLGVVQGGLRR